MVVTISLFSVHRNVELSVQQFVEHGNTKYRGFVSREKPQKRGSFWGPPGVPETPRMSKTISFDRGLLGRPHTLLTEKYIY